MVVLGMGVGLFYSSVTTAAITALDPSQASLAGAIVYMCQIAGGSIGVGFQHRDRRFRGFHAGGNSHCVSREWALAIVGAMVALLLVGGPIDPERLRALQHHHRAHA